MNVPDIKTLLNQEIAQAYQDALQEDPKKGKGWKRDCEKLGDIDFIYTIIMRALLPVSSGLAFVQHCQQNFDDTLTRANFFLASSSPRRLRMLDKVMPIIFRNLRRIMCRLKIDHIKEIDTLAAYDCVAFDGHCIESASHTKLEDGVKNKVNSCFIMGMDFRTGLVMPVQVVSTGTKKKHEVPSLVEACEDDQMRWELRYNQISIYDRAVSSLEFIFQEYQKSHFILTREKKNVQWDKVEPLSWDREDAINRNVIQDSHCYKLIDGELRRFRVVEYFDPIKKKSYRYLTCLPSNVPPGVIAELYRRRWQIEKTYDNSKNSLFEQKAWGTSFEAHKVQMYAIVSTLNFIRYFQELNLWEKYNDEDDKNIQNQVDSSEEKDASEFKREKVHVSVEKREKAFQKEIDHAKSLGYSISPLRYIGSLMRLTEFCVRTVQNSILSSKSMSWLLSELKREFKYRRVVY